VEGAPQDAEKRIVRLEVEAQLSPHRSVVCRHRTPPCGRTIAARKPGALRRAAAPDRDALSSEADLPPRKRVSFFGK